MAKKKRPVPKEYSAPDFNPKQAASAYKRYKKKVKSMGAEEVMSPDEFVGSKQWRKWHDMSSKKLYKRKKKKKRKSLASHAARVRRMVTKKKD